MTAPTLACLPGQATHASPPEPGKRELSLAQRLALGSRLAELREAANYTQLEVARKALGFTVSHAAVSRLERGVFGVVDNAKLDKLAAFYGATVESLLSEMQGRLDDEEPEEYRPTDSLTVQPGCAQRLFHLRQAAGLTKAQMCEALGYENGVTLITQWERGAVTPRPDTLTDIAIALKVSAAWLITGKHAKPARPTMPMRLRAMQKIYDLSNRDVALLAELDIERGAAAVGRMSRGKQYVGDATVVAVAQALDVPVDWIRPPEQGFDDTGAATQATQTIPVQGLSSGATKFLCELSDLFASAVLKESDIAKLRQRFMKDLIASQMPRRKNSPAPSLA